MNASIDYFVYACIGWNHNDLYQVQNQNNLNKRLAYAFAEITTATKRIEIEKYFILFEQNKEELKEELNEVSSYFKAGIDGKGK
jgi:hypothetical protein